MKIKTGERVKNLDGKPYQQEGKDLTAGKVIAEALAGDKAGGKMKMYLLAQKAYDEEAMDVDAADLALIKQSVEKCETYNNLIVGQVIAILEAAK